ncbi:hypothetical protein COV61_05450 [Candidatus Micrarchaeota archaeon CG11_big_fil_rev_8_21_14_0_20_47_5]|nr:MAG: hypothetical protein AUJ17_02795 [Candidatus Micrarchaeota archaeon CG1_02_47_40]PIN82624.1 MAG: hypothetical protein COV61_05450 [Candidatus Micrarchaeota archaeon CG11_big_fil_rev_8_21_14_0_20_47_5]
MGKLPVINFRKKLKGIYKLGFIESLRSGNTGIGKTLEELFGIPENNVSNDFQFEGRIIELKSQRATASSRVTLITKSPHWNPLSAEKIIRKYGYSDAKGRQGLKVTITAVDFNTHRLKLEINKPLNRINIIHKKNGAVCYFEIKELMGKIKEKLSQNLLIVFAETRKKRRKEQFHYTEAYFLSDLSEENFEQLLLDGVIVWEFRMHIKENGSVRDHGAGFRISEKHLPELYSAKEKIKMDF